MLNPTPQDEQEKGIVSAMPLRLNATLVRLISSAAKGLLPKEDHFFSLITQSTECLRSCADIAFEICSSGNLAEPRLRDIDKFDARSEAIASEVKTELAKTFLTPIDRGDIVTLVHDAGSVVNTITETLRETSDLRLTQLPVGCVPLAEKLKQAGALIVDGSLALAQINPKKLQGIGAQISELEKQGDSLFREARRKIVLSPELATGLLQLGFLEGLENALDQCLDFAQVLEVIAIKHG